MSTTTTNLSLVKPDTTEAADISVINGNMDILDTAVAAKQNSAVTDFASSVTFNVDPQGGANMFKKIGNLVVISYQSTATALSSSMTLFTLPSGYRPVSAVIAPAVFSGAAFGAVQIGTGGVCTIAQISSSVTARVLINVTFTVS